MERACPYHRFNVTYKEAIQIQEHLLSHVRHTDELPPLSSIRYVGGADVAFRKPSGGPRTEDDLAGAESGYRPATALAAVVIYDRETDAVVEKVHTEAPALFPYVPGYLSFREGPAILQAVGKLGHVPDVMIYDGCGSAHPRGMGLATHMGVLTGIPSIGCAKSLLCGACEEPGDLKGEWTPLTYRDRIVGSCLRTRDAVTPVYVSPGTGVDNGKARDLVLATAVRYRLPEPTRRAHLAVTAYKKACTGDNA